MNLKPHIAVILLLALTLSLPLQTLAVDILAPIPVSDSILRDKEAGITIFGFTVPGFSWDTVAIIATKKIIERVVDSTVKWINNGFEGNPAYVTDPEQYFSDLGDGIAGEFIAGSKFASSSLDFLCSPFQAQIKLALVKSYNEAPPFQCTLTGIVQNIEAFYDDFSQGGWDGWFAMTQNDTGNPYGSYIEAKIELDSRLAKALKVEEEKLSWGRGLLAWQDCLAQEFAGFNQDGTPKKGKCIERGPIKTPGTVIEGQLAGVLGSGMRKLELADEFDELVGALLGALLEKSVFSIQGLFGAPKVTEPPAGGGGSNQMIDIDGDGITDGIDTTGDGQPDLCFFGGLEENSAGPPCKGSRDTGGGGEGESKPIDIDGDDIPDGNDTTGDGVIDECYFGGVSGGDGPPCKGSRVAIPEGEPASLRGDVAAELAKYTLPTTKAQQGQILNAVAWKNKDKGWVLLGKAGGNNCPAPSGELISCDYLLHKPTLIGYDVFGNEGAPDMKATWIGPDSGVRLLIKRGSRTIVNPVSP